METSTLVHRTSASYRRPPEQGQTQTQGQTRAPTGGLLQSAASSRAGEFAASFPVRIASSVGLLAGLGMAGVGAVMGASVAVVPSLVVCTAGAGMLFAGHVAATRRQHNPESVLQSKKNTSDALLMGIVVVLGALNATVPLWPAPSPAPGQEVQ